MSEKLHGGEHKLEHIDTSGEQQKNLERLRERAEQAEKDPLSAHIESLQKSVEQQAISGKEFETSTTEQSSQTVYGITKAHKQDSYTKTLRRVRTRLNPADKALSKVIHQPQIEAVSQMAEKTIGRPSAFLGGSLGAFLGSTGLLFAAKQYGFTYNYAAVFFVFGLGFIAGITVELVAKRLKKH